MTTIKNPSFEAGTDWTSEIKTGISGCSVSQSSEWMSSGSASEKFFWSGCSGCPPPSFALGDHIRINQTIDINSDFKIKLDFKSGRCQDLSKIDMPLALRVLIDGNVVDSVPLGAGTVIGHVTPLISGYQGSHILSIEVYFNSDWGAYFYGNCVYVDNLQIVDEVLHTTPTPTPAPKTSTMMCSISLKDSTEKDTTTLYAGQQYALRAYLYILSPLTGCLDLFKTPLSGKTVEFVATGINGTKVIGTTTTTATGYAAIYWTPTNEHIGSQDIKARFAGDAGYNSSETGVISAVVFLAATPTPTPAPTPVPTNRFDVTVSGGNTGTNTVKVYDATQIPFTDYYLLGLSTITSRLCTGNGCKVTFTANDGLTVGWEYAFAVNDSNPVIVDSSQVYAFSGAKSITVSPPLPSFVEQAICDLFGVTTDCRNWTAALTIDIFTPAADAYIIRDHVSIYTGLPEDPTWWNYLGLSLSMIPLVGGTVKVVSKSKFMEKGLELTKVAEDSPALQTIIQDLDIISRLPSMGSTQLDNLIELAKSGKLLGDFTGFKNYLTAVPKKGYRLQDRLDFEANVKTLLTDNTKVTETAAQSMKISEWAYSNAKWLQEYLQGTTLVDTARISSIINQGISKYQDIMDVVKNIDPAEFSDIIVKLRAEGTKEHRILADYLEEIKYLRPEENEARNFIRLTPKVESTADEATIGRVATDLAAKANVAMKDVDPQIYTDTVINTMIALEGTEPVIKEGLGENVHTMAELYGDSLSATSTVNWRSSSYDFLKNKFKEMSYWVRNNPKAETGKYESKAWSGKRMLITFLLFESSFVIWSVLKYLGRGPGDKSWTARDWVDSLKSISFSAKDACENGDTGVLSTVMATYSTTIENAKKFRDENTAILTSEGTIDVFNDAISLYESDYALRVTCLPGTVTVPDSGTLTNVAITEIVDGDTVKARQGTTNFEVRLLGINTPEKPATELEKNSTIDCAPDSSMIVDKQFYYDANTRMTELALNKTVTLKVNPERPYDIYSRLLAVIVLPDSTEANQTMLKEGRACYFHRPEWDLDTDVVNHTLYKQLRDQAKTAKLGIWGPVCVKPTAAFSTSPSSPDIGIQMTFTDASTPGTGLTLKSWSWNFGDGSTSTLQNPTHTYTTTGSKTVTMTVTNSCGQTDTATKTFTIGTTPTPTPTPKPSPTPTPTPAPTPTPTPAPATWHILQATDPGGLPLSSAKVYVDNVYLGHYTPEDLTFCTGCTCDTIVACDLGTHTVKVTKTGYKDWTATRTLAASDVFSDTPIMQKTFPVTVESVPAGATISADPGTLQLQRIKGENTIETLLRQMRNIRRL
ncbi:MAG: PKD domain-containing protein [Candidatus Methanoperedens sp.]|nr:PKD domain-containing protein [Candidatus Methanoperedens sp.]